MRPDSDFGDFVVARSRHLLRTAYLMTDDWGLAEDLVQAALIRTWLRWKTVIRKDNPEQYIRKVMISLYLSGWRRKWRGEKPSNSIPELADPAEEIATLETRLVLGQAVKGLPRRQRAVVVLRYFDDMSEQQVADVLGCSVGTVKSQASKALAKLRSVMPNEATRGEAVGQ